MYESNYGSEYGVMFYLFIFALYFYFALTQYKIAQKTSHHSPWWAFVPLLNVFQLVQMAGKQWWWFLLFFVPVVNIVCLVICWMNTAKNCGHPPIWGFLTIIPFLNFISLGIMAFTPGKYTQPGSLPKHEHPTVRQTEKVS